MLTYIGYRRVILQYVDKNCARIVFPDTNSGVLQAIANFLKSKYPTSYFMVARDTLYLGLERHELIKALRACEEIFSLNGLNKYLPDLIATIALESLSPTESKEEKTVDPDVICTINLEIQAEKLEQLGDLLSDKSLKNQKASTIETFPDENPHCLKLTSQRSQIIPILIKSKDILISWALKHRDKTSEITDNSASNEFETCLAIFEHDLAALSSDDPLLQIEFDFFAILNPPLPDLELDEGYNSEDSDCIDLPSACEITVPSPQFRF